MPTKINATTIEMDKVIPEVRNVVQYDRLFVEKQIKDIEIQRDKYVEDRNGEIAELNLILAEMDRLGITTKAVN